MMVTILQEILAGSTDDADTAGKQPSKARKNQKILQWTQTDAHAVIHPWMYSVVGLPSRFSSSNCTSSVIMERASSQDFSMLLAHIKVMFFVLPFVSITVFCVPSPISVEFTEILCYLSLDYSVLRLIVYHCWVTNILRCSLYLLQYFTFCWVYRDSTSPSVSITVFYVW